MKNKNEINVATCDLNKQNNSVSCLLTFYEKADTDYRVITMFSKMNIYDTYIQRIPVIAYILEAEPSTIIFK